MTNVQAADAGGKEAAVPRGRLGERCDNCGAKTTLMLVPRIGPAPGNMLVCSNPECPASAEAIKRRTMERFGAQISNVTDRSRIRRGMTLEEDEIHDAVRRGLPATCDQAHALLKIDGLAAAVVGLAAMIGSAIVNGAEHGPPTLAATTAIGGCLLATAAVAGKNA